MTLWEFNSCLRAYNNKQLDKGKEQMAVCWQTAALTGNAFAGKLRPLKNYLKDEKKVTAPKVDRDEFERRLKMSEERRREGGA